MTNQSKRKLIFHITSKSEWHIAQDKGVYLTPLLEMQGFIHCSKVSQVLEVANYFFKGQQDLVLLCIDPEKLFSELRDEALGLPETYPHIYDKLNLEAVVKVIDFPTNSDGFFNLPAELN